MTAAREVFIVAGARPNFMKVAPILRAMNGVPSLTPRLVHTGQHYDEGMSDVFFQQLRIPPPDVHLGVGSGTQAVQTAKILVAFEELLLGKDASRCGVVVVGDVTSTMACTLAAVKLGVKVAHVEAGLRSFDRAMPEEINRVVTDALADLLLVSEESGAANLRAEGVPESRMRMVGNVMIDTLLSELPAARETKTAARLGVREGEYAYVTLHRPSNVDSAQKLRAILELLNEIAARMAVVFPVHPRTRARIAAFGLQDVLSRDVVMTDPLGYHESVALVEKARMVLTDSGGVQEESAVLGVPCLTLRANTERPATVTYGTNVVVGDDPSAVMPLVGQIVAGTWKKGGPIPMWDGSAAPRIVAALAEAWG
jgi:UDP-N-acetylglucosamine 2-epimerase (non-hydrolysing)